MRPLVAVGDLFQELSVFLVPREELCPGLVFGVVPSGVQVQGCAQALQPVVFAVTESHSGQSVARFGAQWWSQYPKIGVPSGFAGDCRGRLQGSSPHAGGCQGLHPVLPVPRISLSKQPTEVEP